MLWRSPFSTRAVESFSPVLEPKVVMIDGREADARSHHAVIGGMGLESWAAQEIWARLFWSEFGQSVEPLSVIIEPSDTEQVELVVPRSLHGRVGWSAQDWTGLRPEVFAWCPSAELLMVGPATEEAWDQMAAAARTV